MQSGRLWDDISGWDDGRLYGLFYPYQFKYKPRYAPVDYPYVHKDERGKAPQRSPFGKDTVPDVGKTGQVQADNMAVQRQAQRREQVRHAPSVWAEDKGVVP